MVRDLKCAAEAMKDSAAAGGKPKALPYQIIDAAKEPEPYALLQRVRTQCHGELCDARIGLAWRRPGWKPDADGLQVIGKCIKISDLHKEFMAFDFIIVLAEEVWKNDEWTDERKEALLDHELMHAAPSEDDEGGLKVDERGRTIWRTRKHDIEEFREVVERRGCYKQDLEQFARTIMENTQPSLFGEDEVPHPTAAGPRIIEGGLTDDGADDWTILRVENKTGDVRQYPEQRGTHGQMCEVVDGLRELEGAALVTYRVVRWQGEAAVVAEG
jgi:hypothetical protein